MSREEASTLLNVGNSSVNRAIRVRREGVPELIAAVEAGDISAFTGAGIAMRPPAEQRAAVREPRPPQRRNQFMKTTNGKDAMDRVDRAVESMCNLSDVLAETASLNGDKRRAAWAERLRDVRTTLTRFITECER